jgi:ribonuclease P protein subunit RPR2
MKQLHRDKPKAHTELALERVSILFTEAAKRFPSEHELSDRYVELALKISTKYKVRLPQAIKKRFCKTCHSFIQSPQNCKIRLNSGKLCYHCLVCGAVMRYPYKQSAKTAKASAKPAWPIKHPSLR